MNTHILDNIKTAPVHSAHLDWVTPDGDAKIAFNARWSAPKNQRRMSELQSKLQDKELMRSDPQSFFLYQGEYERLTADLIIKALSLGHVSILETASMSVHIKTTLRIAPHLLRHSSAGFQQFSRRYCPEVEIDMPELRLKDGKARNPSIDGQIPDDILRDCQRHIKDARELYERLLDAGIHSECASSLLPQSTVTFMTMTAPIRTWYTACLVRCRPESQKETQLIFNDVLTLLKVHYPCVHTALISELNL